MKNIYKITKGQLISIWIFGIIGFIVSISESEYSGLATFLAILIPAILIFYTIGWRAFNKIEEINNKPKLNLLKILPSKKKLIFLAIVIILIIAIIFGVFYLIDFKKERLQNEQLKQEYNQAILKVGLLKEQASSCLKPVFEKLYQEEVRSCNLLKNKVKADYDFCMSLTSISTRASCLYDNDYEIIDCSQETLDAKSRSKLSKSNVPQSCQEIVDELINVNSTIESYSKLNKNL